MLSAAKHLTARGETLRCAQGDMLMLSAVLSCCAGSCHAERSEASHGPGRETGEVLLQSLPGPF